jgi:hypothetical protein
VRGSFDVRTLLGEREERAAAGAARHGCDWRVIERNGRGLAITLDARRDRVDARIDHGVVTSVAVY